MSRSRAAVFLIAMVPGCAYAQRGGASSAQNNHSNPVLNINYQSAKTWKYFRLSDLLKMKRISVDVADPTTHQRNVYEGVPLVQLDANSSRYKVEVFRDVSLFGDKLAVSSADLNMESDAVLADTVNGKRLGSDHPFCFIGLNRQGNLMVVRNLSYIRFAGKP
jgi:hypothetical protein